MSTPLILDGDLTVFAASEVRERLLNALELSPTLILDASGVSEVDGAGIQLLIAARQEAQQRGGTLILQDTSAQLQEAIDLIDMRIELGDTSAQAMEYTA